MKCVNRTSLHKGGNLIYILNNLVSDYFPPVSNAITNKPLKIGVILTFVKVHMFDFDCPHNWHHHGGHRTLACY